MSANDDEYVGEELTALPWSNAPCKLDKEIVRLIDIRRLVQNEFSLLSKSFLTVGMFVDMPFRAEELPAGWYVRDGKRFSLDSAQGAALNSLSDAFKSDWGITVTADGINVPNAFDENGAGYFARPVNGVDRTPGSIQQDAARAVTATAISDASSFASSGGNVRSSGKLVSVAGVQGGITASGAFKRTVNGLVYSDAGGYQFSLNDITIDINASISAPLITTNVTTGVTVNQENVDTENRPKNIGMTPCIFLGIPQ